MSAFFKKIFSVLAPDSPGRQMTSSTSDSESGYEAMSRQAVLDALLSHFDQEMAFESTQVSMLFHTSFIVYLREQDYDRISPSFLMTAKDAVTLFLRRIKEKMEDYPGYMPHSRYWVLQLVNIPEGTMIDGVTDQEMDSNMIIVKSSIFPEDEYDSFGGAQQGEGRVVTTLHTKSSMKALPKALNMTTLLGLDQLDKDKYRIKFDQDNYLGFGSSSPFDSGRILPQGVRSDTPAAVARLTADDGRFVAGGRVFTTFQMRGESVKICGRNGMAVPGESIVNIDSDEVMNPHCIIRRDPSQRKFYIAAYGPVRLNERKLPAGGTQWFLLPDRSIILLNEDTQISFSIS